MKSHEHPICDPRTAMESTQERKAPDFSLTSSPTPKAPAAPPATATAPVPATTPAAPTLTGGTPAAPAATPVVDIKDIAKRIHTAIDGAGTDEVAVYKALGELNKDSAKIAQLKRCYLDTYNTTLESDILDDFSDEELAKCLELLGHSGGTTNWGQTQETSKSVTETISNAPAGSEAWNGTYTWDSKYQLYFNHDQNEMVVRLRLYSTGSASVRKSWKDAVEAKWGDKFSMEATNASGEKKTYKIKMMVSWVDSASDAHYTVTANAPTADEGGRAGLGGTTSMTGWGTADTVDVTHEVGHMLGAPEDYFTTNGVDHTHGGARHGSRDTGGGIMNNPSEDPFAGHYDSIRREAARALGLNETQCVVK